MGGSRSTPSSTSQITSKTRTFGVSRSTSKRRSKVSILDSESTLAVKSATSRKRKRVPLDADEDDTTALTPAKDVNASKKKKEKKDGERRLKIFRKKAPVSFLEKLDRAQTQRMIVLARKRVDTEEYPQEEIDIVGSTGNIYRVTIGKLPNCTCPDSRKGHECKHKVYALHTVLKAPEHFQYQLAFLSTELQEIFASAPLIPTDKQEAADKDGKRKPTDGECPICYTDLDESNNELLWCKAACGNNLHRSCFEQWAASQQGATVKCVYCRTPWEMDHGDMSSIVKGGQVSEDGYVNVAEHFGMSRARDYSSYHQPWVRRQFSMG